MRAELKTLILPEVRAYTGIELRPHFIYERCRLAGSALIVYRGPCEVKTEHLVDWEDRIASDYIRAQEMLSFQGEFFGLTIGEGVWMQRLFVSILKDALAAHGISVQRSGDDLLTPDMRKLSVSIVAPTPVSQLLHIGLNLQPQGAPVPAVGLVELWGGSEKFEAAYPNWLNDVLTRFRDEWNDVSFACVKVRPVV